MSQILVLQSFQSLGYGARQCFSAPLLQDGYAVVSSDPPQEYEVAFESLAGTEQQTLQPGTIAYISTGKDATHPAWKPPADGNCGTRSGPWCADWPTWQHDSTADDCRSLCLSQTGSTCQQDTPLHCCETPGASNLSGGRHVHSRGKELRDTASLPLLQGRQCRMVPMRWCKSRTHRWWAAPPWAPPWSTLRRRVHSPPAAIECQTLLQY